MEEAVLNWLLASTAVAAIVGTRVNWDERPQAEELPSVTLATVSARPGYTLAGAQSALRQRVVQVDCWGRSALEAVQLAGAVEARLDAINLNAAATPLEGSFVQRQRSSREDLGGGGKVFRQSMDFAVWRRS